MNIMFFFVMWIQCVGQVCIVCVPLENQSYRVMMCATDQSMSQSYGSCAKDQSNGNMLYVQTTNLMGTHLLHVQRTNPPRQCMFLNVPMHGLK